MWKLAVGAVLLLVVIFLFLGPKFYFKDGTHACGIAIGANETVTNIHNQTCYCSGEKSIQLSETNDDSRREFCQGYGISFSR